MTSDGKSNTAVPAWHEAADRCVTGSGTPLDYFVWQHEPAGRDAEVKWRTDFAAALAWIKERVHVG